MQELIDVGASLREINRIAQNSGNELNNKFFRLNALQKSVKFEFLKLIQEGSLKEVITNCPICGSNESDFFCGSDRIGLPVETVLCKKCPTLYSRSRMDELSLEIFYSKFYRSLYVGSAEPTENFFDNQVSSGYKIIERLAKFGRTDWSFAGLRVLEIGCGAGGILLPFKTSGADVLGVDLDDKYMDKGRSLGLELKRGSAFEILGNDKFDLIILKDVLEHLVDVERMIKILKKHLSDFGQIYVQVPSFEALEFLGYRSDYLRYFQNAHLVHFSQASLNYIFSKHELFPIYSDLTGFAIFGHERSSDYLEINLLGERSESLKRIANTLNRRKRVTTKEVIWRATPEWVKTIYGRS